MNLAGFTTAFLRRRLPGAALTLLMLALGVATIVMALLFNQQAGDHLTRDARGIDLVVGAKGSPLQIILSSVHHLDVPTGNIALRDARDLRQQATVKGAIPLALGDSTGGLRIVGTSPDYLDHYGATLAHGRIWETPMEAVLGASAARQLNLDIGDTFTGTHGLAEGGHTHDYAPYRVVGVLEDSPHVIDRLVLTAVQSVWHVHSDDVHEHEYAHGHGHGHDHDHDHGHDDQEGSLAPWHAVTVDHEDKEITALLITYSSPLAAATMPRAVNARTNLQAASPAFETARLMNMFGSGVRAIQGFAALLVAVAALGLFVALYRTMLERRYEVAVMRVLGAGPGRVFWHVMLEGMALALIGALAGMALGHTATSVLGAWLESRHGVGFTGLTWAPGEAWLPLLAALLGALAAALPAVMAYRTDIARVLARR